MVKKFYCIKDLVTGEIGNPMPFINEASAVRYFRGICKDNKNIATDLQLFHCFDIDYSNGFELKGGALTFIEQGFVEVKNG